jgi:hypothetical protein
MCHSGKPGTPTQVHESTINSLVVPAGHSASGVPPAAPSASAPSASKP